MTNTEKLKQCKRIVTAIQELPESDQRVLLTTIQEIVSNSMLDAAASVLRVLDPMGDDERSAVLSSVAALVGEAPAPEFP